MQLSSSRRRTHGCETRESTEVLMAMDNRVRPPGHLGHDIVAAFCASSWAAKSRSTPSCWRRPGKRRFRPWWRRRKN